MPRGKLAIAVVAALAVSVLVPFTTFRGSDGPDLRALVDDLVEAGAPGALIVTRENGRARAEAAGIADPLHSVRMGPDSRFRAGSISKTFVATVVLQLVQEGKIGLDDTVEGWLPGLVEGGRRITVRQLLSHTSGLPDYVDDPRLTRDLERRWAPVQLVALASSRLRTATGRFAYASTNYILLGLVAEKAAGLPLARLLDDRIFEPLDLRHTGLELSRVHGPHVRGHRPPSHQGVVTGVPVPLESEEAWWAWSAGAVVSTAEDLQRFFAALLEGRLLGRDLLGEMETLIPAGRNRYGLGIAVYPTRCGPAWGHTGNVLGTVVVAWSSRDGSRQLVLVVNSFPLSPALEATVREAQDAAFCSA